MTPVKEKEKMTAGHIETKVPQRRDLESSDEASKDSSYVLTASLLFSFFGVGLIRGQDGVVFLDLLLLIQADIADGSLLFLLGAVGYVVGSLVAGVVYDRCDKALVYFLASTTAAVFTFVVPYCPTLPLMGAANVLRTLCVAFMVSGGTFICANLWKEKAGPFIQALFFQFAVGCLSISAITEPFLLKTPDNGTLDSSNSGMALTLSSNTTVAENGRGFGYIPHEKPETRVHMSFIIVGIVVTVSGLPFLISFWRTKFILSVNSNQVAKTPKRSTSTPIPLFWKVTLYVLFGLIFSTYGCLEKGIGTFFMTFAVKHLSWDKSSGSGLMACFYGAFAGSRFFRIFIAKYVSAFKMVMIDFIFLICGATMLFFVTPHTFVVVWIAGAIIGGSLAGILPSVTSYINSETIAMTGSLSAYICVSYAIGTMVHLPLLGYLFKRVSPVWFVYLTFADVLVCFLSFLVLCFLSKHMEFIPKTHPFNMEAVILSEKKSSEVSDV